MSVLRIYQNPIAINSLRNLKVTGMAISRSLERLSSGLRINRAADDAAGLSISEKLRAQIRGLNRASSNALDGISMIQTAEGALNEVHAILQRMRELSVQAANGIYTADDRAALQLEVSQLIDEVNRIATATEFNTKKLLDGTLGALISTDDFSKVNAAVVGPVGKGGNFVMKAVAKSTGALQVHKTDVFSTSQQMDAVGRINYLNTWRADAEIVTAGPDGIGNTGIDLIEVVRDPLGSVAVQSATNGLLRFSTASLAGAGLSLGRSLQARELSVGDKFLFTMRVSAAGTSTIKTFSMALPSFGTDFTSFAGLLSNAVNGAFGAGSATVAFANGLLSVNNGGGATAVEFLNSQYIDTDGSGSDFYLSFGAAGTAGDQVSNLFFSAVNFSFFNNGNVTTGQIARPTAVQGEFFSIGTAGTGTVNFRLDIRFDYSVIDAAGEVVSDSIGWHKYTGGNSLQDYGKVWQSGPAAANATFLVSAISNRTYAVYEFDNAFYTSLVSQGWDQTIAMQAARGLRMSNTAGVQTFSIADAFDGAAGSKLENVHFGVNGILQAGETATFNLSTNNVLTADQQSTLASINRFQQFGVFLGRNNVEMTLYLRGTDRAATINISRNDTLEDVAGKISLAIWNPDGQGVVNSGILNGQAPPDLVHVNTIGLAKGTMSITTPIPGAELVFAGDEALLNALSLLKIREGESPVYSVTAFNLELGVSVGSVITDTREITGLLPGLRIFFDNTLGLRLDPEPPTDLAGGAPNGLNSFAYLLPIERPQISLSGVVESFFIHVAPREFSLQIGANQGQTISTFIADHSAKALGVEGLLITDTKLAQEAISIVDVALSRVSNMRSRLGAIQNRLESTIRNLDVASENLTASESRIRDADVAQETLVMTRNQILLQAGVAALAQANQLPQAVLQLLR